MKDVVIRKIMEVIPDPAFFINTQKLITYINRVFEKEFGNANGDDYASFFYKSRHLENDPKGIIRSRLGNLFTLELLPYKYETDVSGWLGILRNIGEIKRLEDHIKYLEDLNKGLNQMYKDQQKVIEELTKQALTDGLTGLFNHRHFWERVNVELKRANRYSEPLSCLMIDIDDFKYVNDRFDHQFGDIVLKKIAKILKAPLRATDILSRYGGDEFAVLLPNTDYKGSHVISKKIIETVRKSSFHSKRDSANVRISLGVSSYPLDNIVDSNQLVEYADAALYQAKSKGKDRICYFHEMKHIVLH